MSFRTLTLLAVALWATLGCKKEEPATPPPPPAVKEEPQELDLSTAVASKVTDVYEVSIAAPESPAKDEKVEATITVQAKAGMHVNAEYPINFKPAQTTNSAKFSQAKYELLPKAKTTPCEEGKGKDFCTLAAPVEFVIDVAGPRRVEGVLAFSVCDKNRCLIEKATLGMDVAAK